MKTYEVYTWAKRRNKMVLFSREKINSPIDLDNYVLRNEYDGLRYFNPDDIKTNRYYTVCEFEDGHFRCEIVSDYTMGVWSRWMESVKEVF